MLIDKYNRHFSYLRLSITDLCNFSCKYCLPNNIKLKAKNYLSIEEIYNLILILSELGIQKIRITGGEPTVRKDFLEIGKIISSFKNIKSLVFTTNGYKLANIALKAYSAGFNGVNISLDTLNKNKFSVITGKNYFSTVLHGIFLAINIGLNVKINVVLSKFFSLDDFENFYSLLKYKNVSIRFIEQMETNLISKNNNKILDSRILSILLKNNGWNLLEKKQSDGPANVFVNNNFLGKIGIINPYSSYFCTNCNRIRISSTGDLFLCLFGGKSYSIRHFLNSRDKHNEFKIFLINKLKYKSYSHNLFNKEYGLINYFSSIGG